MLHISAKVHLFHSSVNSGNRKAGTFPFGCAFVTCSSCSAELMQASFCALLAGTFQFLFLVVEHKKTTFPQCLINSI